MSVQVADIMLRNEFRNVAPVEHGAQDFGGHDDAARVGVDGHVTCHQPHVLKLLAQLPELLVA